MDKKWKKLLVWFIGRSDWWSETSIICWKTLGLLWISKSHFPIVTFWIFSMKVVIKKFGFGSCHPHFDGQKIFKNLIILTESDFQAHCFSKSNAVTFCKKDSKKKRKFVIHFLIFSRGGPPDSRKLPYYAEKGWYSMIFKNLLPRRYVSKFLNKVFIESFTFLLKYVIET